MTYMDFLGYIILTSLCFLLATGAIIAAIFMIAKFHGWWMS